MKIETKEIYKCEFCNKLYQRKHFCIRHELICLKNPANYRVCFDCKHLTKEKTTIYKDYGQGEQEESVELFFCKKINSFLYPPKVEIKKNYFDDLGDTENQPMKKECEFFDINQLDDFIF